MVIVKKSFVISTCIVIAIIVLSAIMTNEKIFCTTEGEAENYSYRYCVDYLYEATYTDEESLFDEFKEEYLEFKYTGAMKEYESWKQYVFAVMLEHGYFTDKIAEVEKLGYWEENYTPPFHEAGETAFVSLVDDSGNEIIWNLNMENVRHYFSTAYNGIITTGYKPSTCKISSKKIKLKEYGPDPVIQQIMYADLLETLETGFGEFVGYETLTIDKTNSVWPNANERANDIAIVHNSETITTDVEDYYAKGGYVGYVKRQETDNTRKDSGGDNKKSDKKENDKKDSGKSGSTGETKTENPPTQHIHDYEQIIDPATCDHEGLITYKCECGDTYTEVIPKLEHDWVEERVDSTCKEPGYVKRVCGNCGLEEIEELPLADHGWEILEQKDSTCAEEGYNKYICKVCGEEDITVIPVKEHSWEKTGAKDPTCTEEGYIEYTCSVCGEKKQETIAPEGHEPYVETKDGKVLTICSKCGEVLSEKEVEKTASSKSIIIVLIAIASISGGGIAMYMIKKRK